MPKEMEGDNRQRRAVARQARKQGKAASDVAATTGSSKQRAEAPDSASHQERIDLMRQGKQKVIRENTPEARPGSRDPDTPNQQRHPKL